MNLPTLLLVDVQKGLDNPAMGKRNNPEAEQNIAQLLQLWRQHALTVVHIKHCSTESDSMLRPEHAGNDFKDIAKPLPGETIFTKSVNSAFIGTALQGHLNDLGSRKLVIAGLTTEHCISTTTRMAGNLGFDVILVSDATAAFDKTDHDGIYYSADQIHNVNLASLNGEFCTVQTTEQVSQHISSLT